MLTINFHDSINPPHILLSSGKPDPPQKVEILEITKNSATIGWVKPMRDGGAKIDGYVIDYLEMKPPKKPKPAEGEPVPEGEAKADGEAAPEGEAAPAPAPAPASASEPEPETEEDEDGKPKELPWTPYTVVKDLSITVVGLKLGRLYKFRVAARNMMGCSLPTETREAHEIKELLCKYCCFLVYCSPYVLKMEQERSRQ